MDEKLIVKAVSLLGTADAPVRSKSFAESRGGGVELCLW